MRRLILLLLLPIITATICDSIAARMKPRRTKVITLERGACFGTCPVYKLTIFSDGTVSYQGIEHVKKMGRASGRISRKQLQELVLNFQDIHYFNLPESLTPGTKHCPQEWTDMPSTTTSLTWQGRSKTIHHYHGCQGTTVLDNLTQLENKIDKAVGVTKWTS